MLPMKLPDDGLILVLKRDCPTCRLIEPVARALTAGGGLSGILCQDDPAFPEHLNVTDDRDLQGSWGLGIEIVPTLIRREKGVETARAVGWNREQWQSVSGCEPIGAGLPASRPGCGSLSDAPGMAEELQARFGQTGLSARTVSVDFPADEFEQMFDRGWSDGLPVVPPTAPRVLRMLAGTTRPPGELIGEIPPALAPCTVEKAAINAVMSGCRPEYFAVVLAALDAALDPAFSWYGLLSTTMGVGPVVIVNGPVAKRIGLNSGMNVLGQGNRANATIARALQLVARNVGGAVPGGVDRSTQGHPGKFGVCFAEDETDEAWEALSVSRGFGRGTSAVTVFAACGSHLVVDEVSREPQPLARSLAAALHSVGHPKHVQCYGALLVLCPEHWNVFKRGGWSRCDVEDAVHEASRRPGRDLVHGAGGITTGMPESWKDAEPAKFNPGSLIVVQAGARAGLMSTIMPGWSDGDTGTTPVTREVTP